jgi:hypothetical protein
MKKFSFVGAVLLALFSCSNSANSGGSPGPSGNTFAVRNAFYSKETGILTVYTNVGDNVPFDLAILNSSLRATTYDNGKLSFDCLLVLSKEKVPSGTEFSVYLTAPNYTSSYSKDFVHINAGASDTTSDTDGDGISDWYEINRYGTDPYSEDTDGDQWTDFEELSMFDTIRHIFDPRIADLPKMDIEISDDFTIGYKYTIGSSTTEQTAQTKSEGFTHTNSNAYTNSTTSAATFGWFVKGHLGGSGEHGFEGFGEFGVDGRYTNTSSYSMTKSFAESSSTTFTDSKAYTSGETRDVKGGLVKTTVTAKNTSNISYTLTNLTLNLSKLSYSDENFTSFVPLKNFSIASQITLEPGDSREILMEVELDVDAFESIVNDPACLNVSVSGYNYQFNKKGQMQPVDFNEAVTKVKAKCAQVRIDYGPELNSSGYVQPEERYWISTKCSFNTNARGLDSLYNKISVYDALTDIAGFADGALSLFESGKIRSIRGKESKASHKEGDWYILKRYTVNNVQAEEMFNDYLVKDPQSESVLHTGYPDYNLKELYLDAGADYSIFYDMDNDEDYLPLNIERQYGSDDSKDDTDDDRIGDFYEVFGWHREAAPEKIFYTNPADRDTDGDDYDDYDDEEPCIPYKSQNPLISECIITSVYDNEKYDISDDVKEAQSRCPDIRFKELTVYDGIVLSLRTYIVYNKISYAITTSEITRSGTSDTAALEALDWKPLNQTLLLTPAVGTNYLWARIVSYNNNVTDYVPVAKLDTKFCPLKNFKANESTVGGVNPSVVFVFDRYSDSRSDAEDGGYILYGVPGSHTEPESLERAEVISAPDTLTEAQTKLEPGQGQGHFLLNLKDLKSGFTLKPFHQNIKWYFYMFAYSGIGDDSTFRCRKLAKSSVTTALLPKGKLVFYPVYVNAKVDRDGGTSPEYYWSFGSNASIDFADLNVPRDAAKELEETGKNGNKYWVFNGSGGYKAKEEPEPNWSCKKEVVFARNREHYVEFTMDVMEKDTVTADDHIGLIKMRLSYDPASDTWGYMDGPTSVKLTTGGGKKKWLYPLNSSDGDIELCCYFEWTYAPQE